MVAIWMRAGYPTAADGAQRGDATLNEELQGIRDRCGTVPSLSGLTQYGKGNGRANEVDNNTQPKVRKKLCVIRESYGRGILLRILRDVH